MISAKTAKRVRQAALELDYHPSAVARSLKTNSTRVLGAVVSNIDDPYFSEILQGIEDTAQSSDYSLFIAASQRDPVREQKIVRALVEHRADGIIICSTSFGAAQAHGLLKYGRPIVVVNNQAVEDYRYSIYHDDVDGSCQVTRHLIGLGHRKIAYLGNASSGRTTFDRLTGYQQAMASSHLPISAGYIRQAPGNGPGNGLAALEHFLALPDRPTALVCFNDMMAVGVMYGLQRAGLRVPEDCSVTGFDNVVYSAYTQPSLTTFDQPKRFIGAEAVRLILGLLQSPANAATPAEPMVRLIQGQLLVRASTAPPSQ